MELRRRIPVINAFANQFFRHLVDAARCTVMKGLLGACVTAAATRLHASIASDNKGSHNYFALHVTSQ